MAQEFTINSEIIESKINQLLPSQGGFAPGVDFSASTMVVPIIDLTETAEGSAVRQDLQTATSLNRAITFSAYNASVVITNTTGYYKVDYTSSIITGTGGDNANSITVSDGFSSKTLFEHKVRQTSQQPTTTQGTLIVFVAAGVTLTAVSSTGSGYLIGNAVQIADVNGNLTTVS